MFIAGATGTIGRPVVRRLVRAAHEVIGLTRTKAGVETLMRLGAKGVIGDALDAAQIERLVVDALRSLESQLSRASKEGQIETVVPRYGLIYGPDVPSTESMLEGLRRRRMPLVAKSAGIASFVHIDDAATATVAALEHGCDGEIYNIVDDSPPAFNDFLLEMARSADAKLAS